ncbi:MAG: SOS response-associated peptidase [Gorillibacterium sp.]|nr:SOS response-associated peptidase [Gorillibacterium sp.]
MCGRFTITISLDELYEMFRLEDIGVYVNTPFPPRYNVAPTQMVPAIIGNMEGKRKLGELRWGLIPSWAKDEKIGYQMINAKAETVAEKPAFKASFVRKRCMIPVDGFYEWKKSGTTKQPYRIVMKDRPAFGLAGLYDTWTNPAGLKVSSCTIITTTPNELMANMHDRMPVILRRADESAWLDRTNQDIVLLKAMLQPYDATAMRAYKVSSAVGNVKNDSPELIEQLA